MPNAGQPSGPEIVNQELQVRAVNGYDKYDDAILYPDSRIFPFVGGVATVSGLKFTKVTSQHGGWFRLEFLSRATLPCRSPQIVIRCNRMKSDAKAESESELLPDDDILRIPGMGKAYRKRWKELNFHTIRDLSQIEISAQSRTVRKSLLEKLRKDRGALTEDRLSKILSLARRVVARHAPDEPLLLDDNSTMKLPRLDGTATDFMTGQDTLSTTDSILSGEPQWATEGGGCFQWPHFHTEVDAEVDMMINYTACTNCSIRRCDDDANS